MQDQNPYAAPAAPVSDAVAGGPELASLGARLGGAIIDAVIGLAVIGPVMFFGGYISTVMEAAAAGGQPPFTSILMWTLIGYAIFVALQFIPMSANGQTWGKKIVGTKIVTLDGAKPDLLTVFGKRYGSLQVIGLVPFIGGLVQFIGILLIFRQDRRTLFDLIGGTRVVVAQ